MPPANTPPTDNTALMTAIQSLKTDITADITAKIEAQNAAIEERLKPVDSISQTLEQARQAQAEATKRQQQQNPQTYQPKSWEQIREDAANDAYSRMKQERDQERQQLTAEEQRKANEESRLEADLDRQIAQLEKNGYLPQIYNPNDYNDPGVTARRELLGAASNMGTPELDKVADTLTQLHRNNMIFDTQTKSYKSAEGSLNPLPGKFAPVGNSSVNAPSRFTGPTTREIRNMSMDDLVELAKVRGAGPVPTSVVDQPGGF